MCIGKRSNQRNKGKINKLQPHNDFFNRDNDNEDFNNDDHKYNDENDMNLINNLNCIHFKENKKIYNDKHIEIPNIALLSDSVQSCLEQPSELKEFDNLYKKPIKI